MHENKQIWQKLLTIHESFSRNFAESGIRESKSHKKFFLSREGFSR